MYLLFPFIKGLGLGLGMIIPIGAQNAYLINQGIRRNFHLLAAMTCIICDVLLIGFGIFGAGELIARNETLLQLITMAGIVFLGWYGFSSFRRGIKGDPAIEFGETNPLTKGKRRVLLGALAVTLLNPHAYLDTVVILGSIGNQMDQELRFAFALGTFSSSIIWFFALTTAAAKFAPWLSRPPVQRTIDIIVGVVMWAIATSLVHRLM
ncbi:LysE family transporter [Endozoicomonas sp.]|nr:LysE family transporter [Endozoicomonas sp.]